MKKEKLIAIVGATATGKSKLAVLLGKRLNGEVISADSAQVYRGLNIGTAKASMAEQNGVPHHLLDIVDPAIDYNIGLFQNDAQSAITEITARGKLPILCGGSGLYIASLINSGYHLNTAPPGDPQRRKALMAEEKARGEGYLYRCLAEKFPLRAEKIHPHDYQRILRGLEMKEDAVNDGADPGESPYALSMYGLSAERSLLYERIEKRVDHMFEQGLTDEVADLLAAGCKETGNALSALGYKEIIPYLKGEYDLATAKELLKKNTRHFAKRQQTWFKRDSRIHWFDIINDGGIEAIADKIIILEKKDSSN